MWHPKEDITFFLYRRSTLRKTLKHTIKVIACPLLWPCYCCSALSSCNNRCPKVAEARKQHERQVRKYKTLSTIRQSRRERAIKNRKRELSIDAAKRSLGSLRGHQTEEQKQSPLFAKLPAELRLKIYQMVLCDTERVHIFNRSPRRLTDASALGGITCTSTLAHEEDFTCSCQEDVRSGTAPGIAILQTCKRLYREAVDILYTGNTFAFSSPMYFAIFSRSILPQRLAKIRNLVVNCNSPYLDPVNRDPYRILHQDESEIQYFWKGCVDEAAAMGQWKPLQPLADILISMTSLKTVSFMSMFVWDAEYEAVWQRVWLNGSLCTDIPTILDFLADSARFGSLSEKTCAPFSRYLFLPDSHKEYLRASFEHLLKEDGVVRRYKTGELVELR